jgi:hypothetical protein
MRPYFSLTDAPDFAGLPKERVRELQKLSRWAHFRYWQFWLCATLDFMLLSALRMFVLPRGEVSDLVWIGLLLAGLLFAWAVTTECQVRFLREYLRKES